MPIAKKQVPGTALTLSNYTKHLGKRIKVLGYSYPPFLNVGDIVTLKRITSATSTTAYFHFDHWDNNGSGICLNWTTFQLLSNTKDSLEDLKKELKSEKVRLENEEEIVNAKLTYMAETGVAELDEDTFRVYQTLKVLDKDATPLQKAESLAKIFRS
jgi:hypothetical protein